MVCSEAFNNGYHVIKSDKDNYLHLIGIHTTLSAEEFFDKCCDGTLDEWDFDFVKPHQSEKSVKGSVREKITVLPDMVRLFEHRLLAEDNLIFRKRRSCVGTYDELVFENKADVAKYKAKIKDYISKNFLELKSKS